MSRHEKTVQLIETAKSILAEQHPMTVRQVYYQLVSRQVIENKRVAYQAVSKALVEARLQGVIPWAWIEDRLRRPRSVSMCVPTAAMYGRPSRATWRFGWRRTP